MPDIQPIPAVTFNTLAGNDLSDQIAPPYDVLDHASKSRLVARSKNNISVIDLPHLPAKTVGPDEAYTRAGETFRQWLAEGILERWATPAFFVYQQIYDVVGKTYKRRGLIANVRVQPFGPSPDGHGGIYPHEHTFSAAKEDRLKLMCATKAQLSPIFGLYSDPDQSIGQLLNQVIKKDGPTFFGKTRDDHVMHQVWAVEDDEHIAAFQKALQMKDIFIADGHHRYNTALNHYNQLKAENKPVGNAAYCLFVMIAMQDPGLIVQPTHRVLGNMAGFSLEALKKASQGRLLIQHVDGKDPDLLEQAMAESNSPHVFGLYAPADTDKPLGIATVIEPDPLKASHAEKSEAWRHLDVAILQHLIVEQICQPAFGKPNEDITWKFPHEISELKTLVDSSEFQLGLVLRATPLESVRQVSEAGELMPQKSTFFYPKLATGFVINPLD